MSFRISILRGVLALGLVLAASSCDEPIDPASRLSSLRILGVRSESPWVRPGASFTTEVLPYDGRADRFRPMHLYWFEDVCVPPRDGKPDTCYRELSAKYPRNEDLTPRLREGDRATFTAPAAAANPGGPPENPVLVFVAACAGHLELVGAAPGYPTSVPFACIDGGRRLDANDFDFAFLRLYLSNDLTNTNPAPTGAALDGVRLPGDRPLRIPRCTAQSIDDCPARKLTIDIGDESQEVDPTSGPPGGPLLREQIWSSLFVSAGKLESEALVLFDARRGRMAKAEVEYRGPLAPGGVDLFVVTHDNRSGAAFQSFKLEAE